MSVLLKLPTKKLSHKWLKQKENISSNRVDVYNTVIVSYDSNPNLVAKDTNLLMRSKVEQFQLNLSRRLKKVLKKLLRMEYFLASHLLMLKLLVMMVHTTMLILQKLHLRLPQVRQFKQERKKQELLYLSRS